MVNQNFSRRQRRLDFAEADRARPDDAKAGDDRRHALGWLWASGRFRLGENQRGVVAAEAERVAHHMCQRRRAQCGDRFEADGGIGRGEAGIGRQRLPAQRLNADHGLDGAARGQRVAEKSFRAGKRRHAIVEKGFQRLRFREVVVARAGAVGVDVVNGRRVQPRPVQRALHRGERARAFRMRRGGVVGVAARAPAGESGENFCAAFQRRLLRFDHEHRRAFAQGHAGAGGVERAAAGGVHQQQ